MADRAENALSVYRKCVLSVKDADNKLWIEENSKGEKMKKRMISWMLAGMLVLQTPTVAFAQTWEKENGVYVNASGGVIENVMARGITVSKYQGEIDWKKVAEDDVSFAMIRLGYLDSPDPTFDRNMREAAANGVDAGIYLYSQALTVDEARKEAEYTVKNAISYRVTYPVVIDLESQYLLDSGLSRQELTDIANAFCKTVQDAGYYPMIYVNDNWLKNYIDPAQIPYDIWYGRYKDLTMEEIPDHVGIWQSTATGNVDGIAGNVCLEFAFQDYKNKVAKDAWHKIDNQWYYCKNGERQMGWIWLEGKWYYLDPQQQGAMAAGKTMLVDGVFCQFKEDGSWILEYEGQTPPQTTLTPSQCTGNMVSGQPGGPLSAAQ